jgi:hypothetical protein
MSLTLWEFFWTETDWVTGPPSVSAADVVVAKFGSKGHDYRPVSDDFWEARERYIKRFVEPIVKQSREATQPAPEPESTAARQITRATIAQAKLRSLQTERDLLLEKVRITQNREELQQGSARIIQISLDILNANYQYYEQAAIILLLDIY